jgi:hypothetical protein
MVWRLFGLQPFSWKTLLAILLAFGAFTLAYFLPSLGNPFLDLVLRSGVYVLVLAATVLFFNISPDLNGAITFVGRFLKRK